MMARFCLWLGAALMMLGIIDSHVLRGSAIIFPIGATIFFFATRAVDRESER